MVDVDEVNAAYWDVLRVLGNYRYLDVSDGKLGSMIRIHGLFQLLIKRYIGVITH